MDADAPFHPAFGGASRIAFRRQPLQSDRALDGADHRTELDQHAVTGGLDDPCLPRPPPSAASNRHISGEDRGQLAFDGLFHGSLSTGDHSTTATATPTNERWPGFSPYGPRTPARPRSRTVGEQWAVPLCYVPVQPDVSKEDAPWEGGVRRPTGIARDHLRAAR
jgi:hypothetical protein